MVSKSLSVVLCVFIGLGLYGCIFSSLSTQWSENFALSTFQTKAFQPPVVEGRKALPMPELHDGKIDTIATIRPKNQQRYVVLQFPTVKLVRKVIIYNKNLFRFDLEYWDDDTFDWKNAYSVRQRRNLENERAQPKYIIERLNFKTDMIRIKVTRTVDDMVISKPTVGPHDMIVNQIRRSIGGQYVEYYRVIDPAPASIREIEVYHLANE